MRIRRSYASAEHVFGFETAGLPGAYPTGTNLSLARHAGVHKLAVIQMVRNWLHPARAAVGDNGGQSIVELALLLPLLVFGLVGGADMARAYAIQLAVQNGARAGAEAYAITAQPTVTLARSAAKQEMNRTPTMQATDANVAVSEGQADASPCVRPITTDKPCFVTVTVTYTFQTITPWPIVPNTANFNRTTIYRLFN